MSINTSSTPPRRLSDARLRNLSKPGKYFDGEVPGLYLEVYKPQKNGKPGSKLWRIKYRLNKKENRFSLGAYPAVGLKDARELARAAQKDVANAISPRQAMIVKIENQLLTQARTFEYVAEQWLQLKAPDLVEKSLAGFKGALANHVYPVIGQRPVSDIWLEHISQIITSLKSEGSMAKRVRTIIRSVLGFAEGRGWVERNVALSNSEELKIRHVVNSNPAIEKPDDLGMFMRHLDDLNDNSVSMALRLLVMLPVKPGELAVMRWEDIDLTGADWRFIVSKTRHLSKTKHIVPLPTQAVAILKRMQKHAVLDDQGKGWVFVSPVYPAHPINPTSLLKALQRMWQEHDITAHGFRATYRTIAHERLGIDHVVLELSLSHRMPGALGAVYARAQLLEQRREAAQQWADYLDLLKQKALDRYSDQFAGNSD